MAEENVNIKKLPKANEIKVGDLIILETPIGTNILDFEDFVISEDNTTFAPLFSAYSDDIFSNRTNIQGLTGGVHPFMFNNINTRSLSAETIKTAGGTGLTTTVGLSTKNGFQTMTITNGIITNIV